MHCPQPETVRFSVDKYLNNNVFHSKNELSSGLPIVDIEPLFHAKARRHDHRRVADKLAQAAADVGFLYITGHPIKTRTIRNVYAEAARFFALPESTKLNHYIGASLNHRGYVPVSEKGDYADEKKRHYEAFDLALELPPEDPDYDSHEKLMGPNQWPELHGFQETVYDYYEQVSVIAQSLLRAFEIHLMLPAGYFAQFMRKPIAQMRLLHYQQSDQRASAKRFSKRTSKPAMDSDMNMGAHTDYECLTVLHQTAPGLQVLNSADEWVNVPVYDDAYIINIGDMMELWTNGLFKATPHRVVHYGHERYSIPYFCATDYDAVIEPLPSFRVKQHRSAVGVRYKPIVGGHHLHGQLLRDFPYLRRRFERGELKLPFAVPDGNLFEGRLAA